MKRKLLLCLLALALAPSVQAAPIVISNTPEQQGDGSWLYSYILQNPSGSGEDIYDFGVDFFGEAFNITKPSDWDEPFYAPGTDTVPSFIDWFSPLPGVTDLTPGFELLGFSFQSALAPGSIVYHIATTERAIDGETVGPNPVPEPGTLLLLGMGATGLIARRRRSKPRA